MRGRTMALDTRYEVRRGPEVLSSTPAESCRLLGGSATFAMLVSSTFMNVESITVPAISHWSQKIPGENQQQGAGSCTGNRLMRAEWYRQQRATSRRRLVQETGIDTEQRPCRDTETKWTSAQKHFASRVKATKTAMWVDRKVISAGKK